MTEIPSWWLIVSGLFFAINIIFFAVMSVVVWKLANLAISMKPKVESLESNIQDLVVKVNGIASNVEDLSKTVKETASQLGSNARVVGSNVELVAQATGSQLQRFSPYISGAITAVRLLGAFKELRGGGQAQNGDVVIKTKKQSKLGAVMTIASHFLRK